MQSVALPSYFDLILDLFLPVLSLRSVLTHIQFSITSACRSANTGYVVDWQCAPIVIAASYAINPNHCIPCRRVHLAFDQSSS